MIGLIGFMACDDIIEVVDISNETVTILAPKDQVVLQASNVTFSWEPVQDAEMYHVQVATPSFDGASQIVLDTMVTKTNITKTLEVNDYEWRISAQNSDYATVYVTQGFSITD